MNMNPEKFGPTPNHSHNDHAPEDDSNSANPDHENLQRYTLTELYELAITEPSNLDGDESNSDHLDELDSDELAAYQLYRQRHQITSDDEQTVERFDENYWGTYNSVDEFTRNWAYHMEPMEAVETLLNALGHLEKHMSLAEMALVDRLKDDLDFIFQGGQVTVFSREPREEQ